MPCVPDQDAASDLYGITIMAPTNYTRNAQARYDNHGMRTEFTCVPPDIKAPFNRTEFAVYV